MRTQVVFSTILFNRGFALKTLITVAALLVALAVTGFKRFKVWSQITDVYHPAAADFESRLVDPSADNITPDEEVTNARHLGDLQTKAKERRVRIKPKSPEDGEVGSSEAASAAPIAVEEFIENVDQTTFLDQLKRFEIGDAVALIAEKVNDIALRNAHVPRLMLMFPLILVSQSTGINVHLIYSLLVIFLFVGISLILEAVVRFHSQRPDTNFAHLFAVFFFVLGLGMNGRMVFSLTAASLLLYMNMLHQRGAPAKSIAILLLGALWTSSVSTGVFASIFTTALLWLVFFYRPRSWAPWLVLICGLPWYSISFLKNLWYFGGGIDGVVQMLLRHGLLHFQPMYLIAGAVAVVALWHYRSFFLPQPTPRFMLLQMTIGFGCAAFGHTVATTTLPPLIALLTLRVMQVLESAKKIPAYSPMDVLAHKKS